MTFIAKIRAPFSPIQIKSLNEFQRCDSFHPFTCGNNGCSKILTATVDGWVCDCGYTQDWAHDFMADYSWETRKQHYMKLFSVKDTENNKSTENVDHPSHYNAGDIECIDAIRSALTEEEFRGFVKGVAIKYAWREKHKGGDEDLRKLMWYVNYLLTGEIYGKS
jgi:hypothetical protein